MEFLVIAYDGKDPQAKERRLRARPAHLENVRAMKQAGSFINGGAILDVQHAFGGSAERFRAIARAHGARLLLTCPNMAESTIYRTRDKGGFYDRLAAGDVPPWLKPVPMPKRSPLRLWRIE